MNGESSAGSGGGTSFPSLGPGLAAAPGVTGGSTTAMAASSPFVPFEFSRALAHDVPPTAASSSYSKALASALDTSSSDGGTTPLNANTRKRPAASVWDAANPIAGPVHPAYRAAMGLGFGGSGSAAAAAASPASSSAASHLYDTQAASTGPPSIINVLTYRQTPSMDRSPRKGASTGTSEAASTPARGLGPGPMSDGSSATSGTRVTAQAGPTVPSVDSPWLEVGAQHGGGPSVGSSHPPGGGPAPRGTSGPPAGQPGASQSTAQPFSGGLQSRPPLEAPSISQVNVPSILDAAGVPGTAGDHSGDAVTAAGVSASSLPTATRIPGVSLMDSRSMAPTGASGPISLYLARSGGAFSDPFLAASGAAAVHLPPLRPPRGPQDPYPPAPEEDDRCEVCWETQHPRNSPMVECRGCGVKVHEGCYGITAKTVAGGAAGSGVSVGVTAGGVSTAGDESWFCAVCSYWKHLGVVPWRQRDSAAAASGGTPGIPCPPPLLFCVLCNRPRGAMKVGAEGKWVHVSCVLYNNHNEGPYFRNAATKSAPINIQKSLILHSRQRFCCSICHSHDGYTTGCSFPGCMKRVHIACVFSKGLKPKLQTVTAEVPLFAQGLFCLPGSGDAAETRVVEKLLKIVTCETHSSPNAHAAVEEWERKMLRKSDAALTSATSAGVPSATDPLGYLQGATTPAANRLAASPTASAGGTPAGQPPPGVAGAATASVWSSMPGSAPSQPGVFAQQSPYYPPPFGPAQAAAAAYGRPGAGYIYAGAGWGMTPAAASFYMPYRGRAGFPPTGYPSSQAAAYGMQAAGAYYWPGAYGTPAGMPGRQPGTVLPNFPRGGRMGGVRVAVGINKSLMGAQVSGAAGVPGGIAGPQGPAAVPAQQQQLTTPTPTSRAVKLAKPATGVPAAGAGAAWGGPAQKDLPSPPTRKPKTSGLAARPVKPEPGVPATVAAPSAAAKPKAPKTRTAKSDTGKPSVSVAAAVAVQTKKKKASVAAASSTGRAPAARPSTAAPAKPTVSARRARHDSDQDEEYGVPSAAGLGASSRGFKLQWNKVDSHFKPATTSVLSLLMSVKSETESTAAPFSWAWVYDGSDGAGSHTSKLSDDVSVTRNSTPASNANSKLLDQLRNIWRRHSEAEVTSGAPSVTVPATVLTPISLVASVSEPNFAPVVHPPIRQHLWTLWRTIAQPSLKDEIGATPASPANVTVTQRPPASGAAWAVFDNSASESVPGVKLVAAYRVPEEAKAALLSGDARVTAEDVHRVAAGAALSVAQSPSAAGKAEGTDGSSFAEVKSEVVPSRSTTAAYCAHVDEGTTYAQLVEAVISGSLQPTEPSSPSTSTGALASSTSVKKRGAVDLSCWADIARMESLVARRFQLPPFCILVKKIPVDLVTVAKLAHSSVAMQAAAVQKFFGNRESVAAAMDPSALKKIATMSKKILLRGAFWELNPPFPTAETKFRSLLPRGSVAVNEIIPLQPQTLAASPENWSIPIPDETTKELLAVCQKARTAALAAQNRAQSSPLTPEELGTARRGEDLVRLIAHENFWRFLLFHDDFVRRQSVYYLMVWAKRRAKLRRLTEKFAATVERELARPVSPINDIALGGRLRHESDCIQRWSALRAAVKTGHQDPGMALVQRVELEHANRPTSGAFAADMLPPAPGTGILDEKGATPASQLYFCLVCFGADLDNLNPIVTCHWCGIKVHKNCYAIGAPAQLDLESLEWYCDRCEHERKTSAVFKPGTTLCAFCLQPGGALKRLHCPQYPRAFVHITCAMWLHPLVTCPNLAKLAEWEFDLPAAQIIAEQHCCHACARFALEQQQESGRAGGSSSRRGGKTAIVADDDDADDPMLGGRPSRSPSHGPSVDVQRAHVLLDTKPTPDFPLGRRGLPVKCRESGCEVWLHPLCAWLQGLRVEARDNFAVSMAEGFAAPGLDIRFYCNDHVRVPRLPAELISTHRHRAYLTQELQQQAKAVLTASPVGGIAAAAGAVSELPPVPLAPSVEPFDPSAVKSAPEAPPELEQPHLTGGRRPSLTATTVPEADAAAVASLQTLTDAELGDSSESVAALTGAPSQLPGQDRPVLLAGADVYAGEICQVCFRPAASPDDFIECAVCRNVRCHRAPRCAFGVLATVEEQLVCTACSVGTRVCALCPRLGGAHVRVPIEVSALVLRGAPASSPLVTTTSDATEGAAASQVPPGSPHAGRRRRGSSAGLTPIPVAPNGQLVPVHKFCLQQSFAISFQNKMQTALLATDLTSISVEAQKNLLAAQPLSADAVCVVCRLAVGVLTPCASCAGARVAHKICAGLCGWLAFDEAAAAAVGSPTAGPTDKGAPPPKRRRVVRGGTGALPTGFKFVCAHCRAAKVPAFEESLGQIRELLPQLASAATDKGPELGAASAASGVSPAAGAESTAAASTEGADSLGSASTIAFGITAAEVNYGISLEQSQAVSRFLQQQQLSPPPTGTAKDMAAGSTVVPPGPPANKRKAGGSSKQQAAPYGSPAARAAEPPATQATTKRTRSGTAVVEPSATRSTHPSPTTTNSNGTRSKKASPEPSPKAKAATTGICPPPLSLLLDYSATVAIPTSAPIALPPPAAPALEVEQQPFSCRATVSAVDPLCTAALPLPSTSRPPSASPQSTVTPQAPEQQPPEAVAPVEGQVPSEDAAVAARAQLPAAASVHLEDPIPRLAPPDATLEQLKEAVSAAAAEPAVAAPLASEPALPAASKLFPPSTPIQSSAMATQPDEVEVVVGTDKPGASRGRCTSVSPSALPSGSFTASRTTTATSTATVASSTAAQAAGPGSSKSSDIGTRTPSGSTRRKRQRRVVGGESDDDTWLPGGKRVAAVAAPKGSAAETSTTVATSKPGSRPAARGVAPTDIQDDDAPLISSSSQVVPRKAATTRQQAASATSELARETIRLQRQPMSTTASGPSRSNRSSSQAPSKAGHASAEGTTGLRSSQPGLSGAAPRASRNARSSADGATAVPRKKTGISGGGSSGRPLRNEKGQFVKRPRPAGSAAAASSGLVQSGVSAAASSASGTRSSRR